jgi:hypothetical protein
MEILFMGKWIMPIGLKDGRPGGPGGAGGVERGGNAPIRVAKNFAMLYAKNKKAFMQNPSKRNDPPTKKFILLPCR